MTKESNIRKEIIVLINYGMNDKSKIYTEVVKNLAVPRPMVRRVARNLLADLEYKAKVLKGDQKID